MAHIFFFFGSRGAGFQGRMEPSEVGTHWNPLRGLQGPMEPFPLPMEKGKMYNMLVWSNSESQYFFLSVLTI